MFRGAQWTKAVIHEEGGKGKMIQDLKRAVDAML
jgi:hypothetical protein